MVRSVARKLYDLDPTVIEKMARTGATFRDWVLPVFSYDRSIVKNGMRLQGTNIYISTGFSAADCIWFIRGLLNAYDLNIEEDFIYSARSTKKEE